MISIMNYLYEADPNHSGYTKMDARRGHGKTIGTMLGTPVGLVGGIPGAILGNHIAASTAHPKDKFTKIDEKSKMDRVGAMSNEMYNAKRMSVGGGIGALIGAGLGGSAGRSIIEKLDDGTEDFNQIKPYINVAGKLAGGVLGAGTGAAVGAAKGAYTAAKKLGYGRVGRIATGVGGPLVGLTTPKRIQDSKK